ncbi:MAG TPA: hypothetical protein VIP70_02195 [Nitrososphaeraceae archaeon]
MTNNDNKPAATTNKRHYNNRDPSVFKPLSELMGRRKAKFLGLQKLLADRQKPRPFWKVLRDARKTAEYAENFIKKHELIESACANRTKSIPKNATIRKEYVNCKKPNCYRGAAHGPYYYAYWKEGKKIKKKYIGQYHYEGQLQQVQERQQDTITDSAASNTNKITDKKRKKKIVAPVNK